jgi:hypothetical protein
LARASRWPTSPPGSAGRWRKWRRECRSRSRRRRLVNHWALDWGCFIADPSPGPDGSVIAERLVAYVFLKRVGNLVRTRGVMAHGDCLAKSVMKLLFHDVMAWLLARQDLRVAGVRYLHYGAIEHGNDGLAAWKRSFEFAPMPFRHLV